MAAGIARAGRFLRAPRGVMLALASIIAVGLAMRLFESAVYNAGKPNNASRLLGDEPGYNNLALDLLDGRSFFDWPGRVPLYPMFLAMLHFVTGRSYSAILYVQAVFGIIAIPLTYVLARRVFPDRRSPALIAAFLAATSYALIVHSTRLQSEVLYVPLVILTAITLWDAFARPSAARFAIAGVILGVGALVRPTLLFFPIALLPALLIRLPRRPALRGWVVCTAAMGVTLLPWATFTTVKYHAVIPLQTSNAFLWQGSPEYYHLTHDQGYTYQRVWSEVIYGPGWQAHDPTSIEGDRWWTHRAVESIKAEPDTYLRYAGEKLGTFWVGDPSADWANSSIFDLRQMSRYFTARVVTLITLACALPIVGLLACLILYRSWRRLVPLYALLIYVTLLHAATHAEFRLSSPFQPLLMVVIGGASVQVINAMRSRRVRAREGDRVAQKETDVPVASRLHATEPSPLP